MSIDTAPRYGVSGRAAAATRSAPAGAETDLGTRWQFSHQWEMLELADGSIFFDSTYADHRVLAAPPTVLRTLLHRVEDGPPATLLDLAELVAPGAGEVAASKIHRLLTPLLTAGILVPARDAARPDWADDELVERFSTQLEWLATLAPGGQAEWDFFRRLRDSHVAVIGLGGAGSLLAQALTATSVGRLTLVDGDVVDRSNLVRQVLYTEEQVGRLKADCMAELLRSFSPYTELSVRPQYVTSREDVDDCIVGADFVAVCADAPRFVLNRWIDAACKEQRTPYLGALAGSVGPMFRPGEPGCFNCLENQFRAEIGERHDLLVDALAAKSSWRYPAFVSGPLGVSHLMTTEIVLHLTQAARPSCAGGVVRLSHPHSVLEPLPDPEGCTCTTH